MMKKCIKCGIEKPNTLEFFRKSTKDKLRNDCRECGKEYNKRYSKENRESINAKRKEYNKEYCEKNKEKLAEYRKEYREKNKQQLKENQEKWYQDNREKILKRNKEKWRVKHPIEEVPEGYKKCTRCNQIKEANESNFGLLEYSKDGFRYSCKECRSKTEYLIKAEEVKNKSKKYYENNKEKVANINKRYREKNKERYRDQGKIYYKNNEEKIKKRVKEYHYNRIQEDVGYRLLQRCRKRLWEALKGNSKSKRTLELIGCSVEELMAHLESRFSEGMSWDNYGEWHVDHIKPCASFDFTKEEQQNECFHYTNLQPLWAEDNRRKSDKII